MATFASYLTTSWDDGHPLDLRLAELLAKYDMPGTFYIPFQSQKQVLERSQIRELSRRFDIGAHTMRHSNLCQSSPEAARREIADSKRYIEDITGVPCSVFAPPGGRYSRSHLAMVRDAGYSGMRTVELMSISHPLRRWGVAMLPTSLQVYPHTAAAYARNAVKRFSPGNMITYFAHAHGEDLSKAAVALVERVAEAGGTFHLWGHSWEVDERRLWPTLERILAGLHERRGRCRRISNAALCEEALQHEPVGKTA